MKKLFLLLLMTNFAVQAQYYSITYIKVSPEKISEFERLENNYWSKIANQNIKNGKQLGWALMRKFGTVTKTFVIRNMQLTPQTTIADLNHSIFLAKN